MPILQGFPRFLYAYWLYFGSISLMEHYFQIIIHKMIFNIFYVCSL